MSVKSLGIPESSWRDRRFISSATEDSLSPWHEEAVRNFRNVADNQTHSLKMRTCEELLMFNQTHSLEMRACRELLLFRTEALYPWIRVAAGLLGKTNEG